MEAALAAKEEEMRSMGEQVLTKEQEHAKALAEQLEEQKAALPTNSGSGSSHQCPKACSAQYATPHVRHRRTTRR